MTSRRNVLIAGATLAAAPVLPLAQPAGARIVADEFWTDKNGVKLWVYRKRLEGATPKARKVFETLAEVCETPTASRLDTGQLIRVEE